MNEELRKNSLFINPNPKQDYSFANIKGKIFHIRCYMMNPSKKEIRNFKLDLLRIHIYIENHVTFIILSWITFGI